MKNRYAKEYIFVIKKIKEARDKKDLSQRNLASKLNISQSMISNIESGQRRVDLAELFEISEILEQPLTFFIPKKYF